MSTYLVTGATGFVGSALVARLLADGQAVRVLLRDERAAELFQTQQATGTRGAEPRVASLGDPNAIADAADGVEVVYHCASENSSAAPAAACAWINVAGTENVCNAARHAGVHRIVYLSCGDVTLANRDRLNWNERRQLDHPALDAVCRTKQLAEELALQQSDRALEVCAVRPAWVWGPGDRRTAPALCREAARGRVSLCGSGDNLVPTVYIDNLIDGLVLAASARDVAGQALHVVDGEHLTAHEFLGQLCSALRLPAPRRSLYALAYSAAWFRERLGGDGLHRAEVVRRGRSALFDSQAAAHKLGYEAKVGIEQGMRELATWAERMGGPAVIAKTARVPTSEEDLKTLIQLAETERAGASSAA